MRAEDSDYFRVLSKAESEYHAALRELATAHRAMQAHGRDAQAWQSVREAEARLDAASVALDRAADRP